MSNHFTPIKDPAGSDHTLNSTVTFSNQVPPSSSFSDNDYISLKYLPGHSFPMTESPRRIHTRGQGPVTSTTQSSTTPAIQRALKQLKTSSTYKVTGNITPHRIFTSEDPNVPFINHIYTDEICIVYSSVGGTTHDINNEDNIHDLFILHPSIQNGPGVPISNH